MVIPRICIRSYSRVTERKPGKQPLREVCFSSWYFMAKKHFSPTDFWNLLNLVEDSIRFGFRVEHGESPSSPLKTDMLVARETVRGFDGETTTLEDLAETVNKCVKCELHKSRHRAVPGEGSSEPLVLVVGEGPGREEDRSGLPFVGPAGKYLDRWLAAVETGPNGTPLNRKTNVFIANIVKCRPPSNRDPQPVEVTSCLPYLETQIALLRPRAILTVGRIALQALTGLTGGIGSGRGKVYSYRDIPLVPTYHPSAVLRNMDLRAPVWEDLKLLKSVLQSGTIR
jgi:DNA polymerase